MTLFNDDGMALSQHSLGLSAWGSHQVNDVAVALLGSLPTDGFSGHLVVAFALQIDNLSHDPAFISSRSQLRKLG